MFIVSFSLSHVDLLDPEVICGQLGVVNAEVDPSINTSGFLDLQETRI